LWRFWRENGGLFDVRKVLLPARNYTPLIAMLQQIECLAGSRFDAS
jgi:hypothetical protein